MEGMDEQNTMVAALSSMKPSDRIAGLKSLAGLGVNGCLYYSTAEMAGGCLSDENAGVRVAAIETLGAMGPFGAEYATALIAELENAQHAQVKVAAIKALAKLQCEDAVNALEGCIDSRTPEAQAAACVALGSLKATKCASKIASCLGGDIEITLGALEGLGLMGEETDKVAGYMSHQEPRVRSQACMALVCDADKYASKAVALLSDSDVFVRTSAMYLIAKSTSKETISSVSALLSNDSPGVKVAAALALGSFGEASIGEADALAKLLTDTSEDTGSLPQSIAGIREKFAAAHRKPACAAAEALAAAKAKEKLPEIVAGLDSKDPEIRAACATAIGQMGSPGAKYEDQLMSAVEDASPIVVKEACLALGLVAAATSANPSAAEKVAECLKSKHPGIKGAALKSLGNMKDEAYAYLEDIVKCCDDPVAYVRYCSIDGISGCGETGQMYASKICKLAYDPVPKVRVAAIMALSGMGERGAGFVEEVGQMINDDVAEVRKQAIEALIAFGTESYIFVDDLQTLIETDPFPDVREAATRATEQIRAPALKNKPEKEE